MSADRLLDMGERTITNWKVTFRIQLCISGLQDDDHKEDANQHPT
jgi:hypothetical protein